MHLVILVLSALTLLCPMDTMSANPHDALAAVWIP